MILKKLLFSFIAVASAQNITYHVITSAPDMSVAVVVDNQTYPLSQQGVLFSGEAPAAKSGYHYALFNAQQQLNATEPFKRAPVQQDTLFEFFNRTRNTFNVTSLPQIYPSLSNRVPSELHNRTYIPTIHLWGDEAAVQALHGDQEENEAKVQLNLTYYSLDEVFNFKNVNVQLAGRSSKYVPKVSYGIKMKTKGKDNLYSYKKLKLRAFGLDTTYIREYIGYSTLAAVGVPASGFSYVRLFINSQPVGLFGLIETFQDPWLANQFALGDAEYKSGNLYQGVLTPAGPWTKENVISDLAYYDNVTLYSLGQYKVKAGPAKKKSKPEKVYGELQEFTKFINETNENTTTAEWEERLNTEGFIRALAIEDMLGYADAYMTLANNYYVYSDPKQSGRMIYIPTDLDTILGNSIFSQAEMRSGNYSEHPGFTMRPLTTKLFSNPTYLSSYQDKFKNLSQTLVNPSVMNPFIDNIVQIIQTDIEWDKTLPRFGSSNVSIQDLSKNEVNITDFKDALPPFTTSKNFSSVFQAATVDSVKKFIEDKSSNIRAFYNLTN